MVITVLITVLFTKFLTYIVDFHYKTVTQVQSDCRKAIWTRYTILTYRQRTQNGVLTGMLCRAIFCNHLSVLPMQIATTIT